jgi:hypothetical protein
LHNLLLDFLHTSQTILYPSTLFVSGLGSSVGRATELWAGRFGDRIPVGSRFSAPVQTGPGIHTTSCTMGTGSFPGVKSGRGVTLNPNSFLVPWSGKGRAIPELTVWAVRPLKSLNACIRVHFTVRPVQSLSACTMVHYTVRSVPEPQCLYKSVLYRTACTEPHYLYKGAIYHTACTEP